MTPPSDTPPSRRRRWAVTIPAMTLPLAISYIYFVWMPGSTIGKSAYGGIKIWLLLWPIIVGCRLIRESRSDKRRMNWLTRCLPEVPASGPNRKRTVAIGAAFGLAVAAFAVLLLIIPPTSEVIHSFGPQIRQRVDDFGGLKYYFALGAFICVLHSALEEFYWRGFVFGHLRHLVPTRAAHLLAALAFAAHHVVVLNQFFTAGIAWLFSLGVALGGLMWSILYQRHGTLLGAWISHLIADIAIIVIGWHLITTPAH